MRARDPDREAFVTRGDVQIFYQVFGEGEPTVLLLPPWSVAHARAWRAQTADLARHCRVVTFDGRGNGRSSRPEEPAAYADVEFATDALAVLDAVGVEQASLVCHSRGAYWALLLAAEHPERVTGVTFIGPVLPITVDPGATRVGPTYSFTRTLDTQEGWAKFNRHYWLQDYRGFLEFFFGQVFSEPHSATQIEDCVAWGLETTPEILIATILAPNRITSATVEHYTQQVSCPVLVIHGTDDRVVSHAVGARLADMTGGSLVTIEGGGHAPHGRDPVKVNMLLREFIKPQRPPRVTWTRAHSRGRRALYVSSPIGLGHVRRDLAIADQLRTRCPDLAIDWLAQHPVTEMLAARGERIHPASAHMANESRHIESGSSHHDLHIFERFRCMDEIRVANYMLFRDVAHETPYDLWIGDEAWELDYFLHENPEEKRAAYVWLTDFVGALPMPDGGEREAFLTADANAEMVEQVERYPRLRDRALFVGNPEDILPATLGPGLPSIREWTQHHFDFTGYITDVNPLSPLDWEALRARLGYRSDEQICLVSVGGSAAGEDLLRRVIAAYPAAKRHLPRLRMIVVAGPRIAPGSLSQMEGLEVRGYVHDLTQYLAACDLAVVQGGLATCMELTASKRPFLYIPLEHHFEQQFHVAYRLDRYGAGRRMDYASASVDVIASAIVEEIAREIAYRDVERDGAALAAARIAELL
jgi:pimeloyl-ACP methyl ester carboxylesterase/predicted glycosyltransferase